MKFRIIQTEHRAKIIYAIQYRANIFSKWNWCGYGNQARTSDYTTPVYYKYEAAHREYERLTWLNRRRWRGTPKY